MLGAVGATPLRAKEAEKVLIAKNVAQAVEEVATVAAEEANPTTDVNGSVEFKRRLVKVVTRAALNKAAERARLT